jgi:carbonic anhydrase/acetyltransferase-like protein (isoleucine patch superfamily)
MNSSPNGTKATTTIGNDVFLGGGSVIVSGKHGIRIGDGAIVAAGAVVLCDVPAHHTYITKKHIYDHTLRQPRIIPPGDTALFDIDLSVRLFNFLRSNDIHTLGALRSRYTDMMQTYGCGKKMQEEIAGLLQ